MERAKTADHVIWDCGSSLYDSFELNSLQKELESALVSRTLSMPHLSHRRTRTPPPPPPPPLNKKQPSKVFRSIQRVIRAVFRPKTSSITAKNSSFDEQSRNKGFYVVYDRAPKFSSIPEVPEFDELSPELRSLVRKSASARFTSASSLGITCS